MLFDALQLNGGESAGALPLSGRFALINGAVGAFRAAIGSKKIDERSLPFSIIGKRFFSKLDINTLFREIRFLLPSPSPSPLPLPPALSPLPLPSLPSLPFLPFLLINFSIQDYIGGTRIPRQRRKKAPPHRRSHFHSQYSLPHLHFPPHPKMEIHGIPFYSFSSFIFIRLTSIIGKINHRFQVSNT